MQRANDLASEHGNPELQPVHILAALLQDHEGIVAPLLERVGLPGSGGPTPRRWRGSSACPRCRVGAQPRQRCRPAANQLLENAFKEAANFEE